MQYRFGHTNIIARDWRKLARFYTDVFGCVPVGPERDLAGDWVDELTGIHNVRIRGTHLALPGCEDGPTLEIFSYEPVAPEEAPGAVNRFGFGHIAFQVDDVEGALAALLSAGGSKLGGLIRKDYPELGLLTAIYVRDPEGNVIELQNWKR
ncbi:MAG: VOC family protein [Solirubrobacterales bacterium]